MANFVKEVTQGLGTILTGMKITCKNFFNSNVTVQYPNVDPKEKAGSSFMPENARNRLFVIMPKCTGCKSCERACPVKCISIETTKVAAHDPDKPTMEDGKRRVMWLSKFDIDFSKCCFCGLCTIACPTGAIVHTGEFEYSNERVEGLRYHFSPLLAEQVAEKKRLLAEEAKMKAEKAAAEKAAKDKAEAEQATQAKEAQTTAPAEPTPATATPKAEQAPAAKEETSAKEEPKDNAQ